MKTQDKFIISGGFDTTSPENALRTVTKYSKIGETETLPDLNIGRYWHACGSYQTDEGENVGLSSLISK